MSMRIDADGSPIILKIKCGGNYYRLFVFSIAIVNMLLFETRYEDDPLFSEFLSRFDFKKHSFLLAKFIDLKGAQKGWLLSKRKYSSIELSLANVVSLLLMM